MMKLWWINMKVIYSLILVNFNFQFLIKLDEFLFYFRFDAFNYLYFV